MDRADIAPAAIAVSSPMSPRGVRAQGLRAITLLAVSAASLFLSVWELTDERAGDFLRQNALRQIARKALLRDIAVAAAVAAVLALAHRAIGHEGRRLTGRISRLVAPVAVAAFLPPLLVRNTWDPLSTAVAIAAVTLSFEALLRSTFGEAAAALETSQDPLFAPMTRGRYRRAASVVAACAAFYAVYMSVFAIFEYRRFGPHGFELAQYDNVLWNMLHGHLFRCGPLGLLRDGQYLGYRSEFSLVFFLPFYAIKPGPETLLVLRAVISALGAVAVHRFASRWIPSSHAAALAICYLLYPPLQALNFEAYSLAPLSIPFVIFAVEFADEKRWVLSGLAAAVALGCGLEMSLDVALLGIFLVLAGYRTRAGAAAATFALFYLVLTSSVIVPRIRAGWPPDALATLAAQDGLQGFDGWIRTLVSRPTHALESLATTDKLGAFLQLVAPVALLPMKRTYFLAALAPIVLFAVVTGTGPSSTVTLAGPHHVVPYLFMATACVLAATRSNSLGRVQYPAASLALGLGTLLCTIQWGAFPPRPADDNTTSFRFDRPSMLDARRAADLADLVAMVPADATFATGDAELAHAARHPGARSTKYEPRSDYVLYGESNGGADAARRKIESGEFTEIATRPSFVLLRRK